MLKLLQLLNLNKIGHRENRIIKAFGIGFFGRFVNIITQFIATRILIEYLQGQEGFGVFTTILSVISWIQLTNLGFGLGLQNTLIDAVAKNDVERQKKLIRSTQIALISICALSFFVWTVSFLVGYPNWATVLNATKSEYSRYVSLSVYFAGCIAIVNVLTSYLNPVYAAHQELHKFGYWGLAGQLLSFCGLIVITRLNMTLPYIILFYSGSQTFLGIALGIWLMIKEPDMHFLHIKDFSWKYLRVVMGVGSSFFLIQITGTLQYCLDNLIISRILGPAEVTPYSLVMKMFNIYLMLSGIIFVPLWSAFGNAMASNDWQWIKKRYIQMRTMMMGSYLIFAVGAILFGKLFLKLWVGPGVVIPRYLIIVVAFLMLSRAWLDIHSVMCNAFNIVRINAILGIPTALLQLGSMYFCIKNWGIYGMVLGLGITQFATGGIIMPIFVFNKIRRGHAGFVNSAHNL